jgi:hypothetical protein
MKEAIDDGILFFLSQKKKKKTEVVLMMVFPREIRDPLFEKTQRHSQMPGGEGAHLGGGDGNFHRKPPIENQIRSKNHHTHHTQIHPSTLSSFPLSHYQPTTRFLVSPPILTPNCGQSGSIKQSKA